MFLLKRVPECVFYVFIWCVGEKLPLEDTLGFEPLQTIYIHTNLYNTLQERENPKKHNRALMFSAAILGVILLFTTEEKLMILSQFCSIVICLYLIRHMFSISIGLTIVPETQIETGPWEKTIVNILKPTAATASHPNK